MRPRKTIPVAEVVELLEKAIKEHGNAADGLQDWDEDPTASVLHFLACEILHRTGNYRGWAEHDGQFLGFIR